MKKIILTFCFVAIAVIAVKAQSVGACNSAQNLCSNPNFPFTANNGPNGLPSSLNVSNPSTNPQGVNSGCLLSGGPGPQWLIMTISVSGTLGFSFGAAGSANPQTGCYDWAMWQYSPTACSQIFNNTLPPVSCNWNGPCSGGTGMGTVPNGSSAQNFQPALNVTAGQQFLILMSNYSNVNSQVSFSSTGTASITCGFNTAICAGQTTTVSPVGFVPMTGSSFTIQPGGQTNTNGSFPVAPTVTTVYTITGSGLNGSGQPVVQTSTTSIVVNPSPLVSPTATQQTCGGVNQVSLGLTFNPSNANPSYTVTWNPVPSSVSNATQTSATGLNPGVTNATVVAAGGCSATASFSMTAAVNPSVTVTNVTGQPSLTCVNGSVCLNAVATPTNSTYFWINSTNSFTSTSPNICATTPGGYTLTINVPASTCVATYTTFIGQSTVVPNSTVSPVTGTISCVSNAPTFTNTVFSPSTNVTTNWYFPGSNFPTSPSAVVPGTISIQPAGIVGTSTIVTCNDVNGCCNTKTINITSTSSFPSFNATSSTNFTVGCAPTNSTTLCMANGTSTNGSVSYYTYTGTPMATPVPTNLFTGNSCITTTVPGQWNLVIMDNVSKCQTSLPVFVTSNTVAPNLSYSIPTQTLNCYTPTVNAVITSTTPNTTIFWNYPVPFPNTLNSASIVVGPQNGPSTCTNCASPYGTYTATVADNNNSCRSTQTVQIHQNFLIPNTLFSLSSPSIVTCINPTVQITATNVVVGTGSVIAATHTFIAPANAYTVGGLGINTISGPNGTYTVITQGNANGCYATKTPSIGSDFIKPLIATAPSFILDCATASLTAAKITVALQQTLTSWSIYLKNYPQGASYSPVNVSVPPGITCPPNSAVSQTVLVDKPGVYGFFVTNNVNGCVESTTVLVNPGTLNTDFIPSATSGFAPLSVSFNNLSSSTGTSGATAGINSVWNFGNGTSQTTTLTSIPTSAVYNNPGTYTVILVASKGDCIDSTYKIITVEIPSKLEIPNVFTPNGDKNNDVFFLKTTNLTEINAIIFDRWGNKVYEVVSATGNIAWDGKNQAGMDCSEGTFFYVIKAKGKDGKDYEQKGNVSLYR